MKNRFIIAILIASILFVAPAFAQTPQTVTLKPGFNFISFTTALTLTPAQFKALSASIEDVYLYSATAGSFLSVNEGTLTTLAAGKGYIVKSKSDASVTVPGGVISAIGNITLKTGFNLVGFSKVPAAITFKQIMETYTIIKGIYKWSPAAGAFLQVVRDNSGAVVLLDGTDPAFKAGESYFFNLTGDTAINYDGTGIVVGATPINPNAAPAVIGGTINSAAGMAELGISYQASGEEFNVTLVDFDGNPIPSIALDAGDTNPKVVKDGQAYSFKTKDFTKSYKVIATSKTTANKMLSTFVGKVKENETVQQRDITPIATAMSLIYADPNKDAASYKQEEQTKRQDQTFMKKLAPVVADLETKRSTSLGNIDFSNPAKLEQAYKDAVLGSTSQQEIAKLKEGLDAVIGKLEEQLSLMEKLKDALAMVATSGRRQNETYVKESKSKIKNLLAAEAADPLKDTTNKQAYKEAKVAYGLVCCDLGDIFKNKVSSATATGAPNMMAAYQALDSALDARAKAEYEEGYNAVKGLTFDENDKAKGLDDAGNAALLKNASELAKTDPAKLDEARKKADVLITKMENEGKAELNLPTGEALPKDKILEEKGEALINGGRPAEAVTVFEKVEEPRVKNFGLGRAYLQLNDLEFAYKNLKDAVKDIVKSNKGFESRMSVEAQFAKINEALFAFAAVIDKLKNGNEAEVMQIKAKLQSEEQLSGTEEQVLADPNVTIGKIIKNIKPTTSFFEVGKKFADGQAGFGGQFINISQETDTLKKAFQEASKLMFKANEYIARARKAAVESERKKLIFEGKTAGKLEAPAADTAFKYLTDAENAFKAIFDNAAVSGPMKGDAHYHLGLAYLAHYRGYKVLNYENNEFIARAKEIFLNIRAAVYDAEYAHLEFAVTQMIKNIENIENEAAGVVVEDNSLYKIAEKILERAESLYFDGQTGAAGAEFDKAFQKFDEAYKSTDAKITVKMKEAALYYSGYCMFYKFKLMTAPDETVKAKALERLKLFRLKFPNSEFLNAAVDMINDITSNVSTLGPVDASQAKPGPEFSKAISLMEKLRLYYRNNFSTTEIETAFNQAKLIFEEIVVKATTDSKYIGTFADPKFAAALKDFRAHAKFMLAILYMERFVMPVAKDVKFKNLALQHFNELVLNEFTQPFIPDVKNFIAQLKEENKPEFAEGQPIFTDMFLNQHMFQLDAVKAGTAQLTMTVGVVIPDATGATVSSVKAELKKFGNTVFDEAGKAMKDLALTKVASPVAGGPEKWELKLTLPKNLEMAPYDFKLVALTSASKSAEAFIPFVVEGQATYARIKNVTVTPSGTSNIFTVSVSNAPEASYSATPGKYTDVYASVMVPQYGYLMQSMDYSQDIKLTRATATGFDFTLDLAKELPKLKQGSYVFLFKLINYNPADPVNSFMMPVDARPFDFFVQSTVAGADNQIVLNAYNKILTIFNGADTAAGKVAAFEKMCDSALSNDMKTALTTAFSSVNGLKFTIVGEPFVQYTTNPNGETLVAVFAPWKLTGTYGKDVLTGVILPDGKMLLPPGKTGAQIMNFTIDGKFEFAKRYVNGVETWLVAVGDAGSGVPVTTEMAKITGFAGVSVPADGAPLQVPALANVPFVKVAGQNFKSFDREAKRVLRILGPNLNMPLVLSDSGSYEWLGDSISFSSEKLKGLKGVYNLEMLDSKYGIVASITLNFMNAGTTAVSAILTQITSGKNSAQPFNLIRPFEIDRNSDLVIKGDKLKPASGMYSLRYYNMTSAAGATMPSGSMATMFVSFAVSTDAGWTNTMITVPKTMLPSSNALADGMPTSIVIWDDAKNVPASSQISVVFLSQTLDSNAGGQAVINTVNGYDAKATVMIDKKATDATGNIDVMGSGFASPTSRHLDLVLQINGRPVHIPIANNMMTAAATASGWADNYIKGTLNYSMTIPVMDPTMPAGETLGSAVTKYPCGLLIWDDQLQKQVTPFMVALKFMATTAATPLITGVNGMPFNGTPIELYAGATDIKVDGQNFGEQSAIGGRGLYLRSQPTPMNPMPMTTFLDVMTWSNTMISATMPAGMQGGIYELFIGETASTTGTGAYTPAGGVVNVSKIVLVNLKSTADPAAATAFINSVNGTATAATVTIADGVKTLNIAGKGFKSAFGTNRVLYMKLKGTNDWKYLADSYMPTWTDASIMVNLMQQPVGAYELFIAETAFGASIISNTVNVVFGQSTSGPNITAINGITVTPGMMITLKSDFTSLEILGKNFGANTDKSLIVRFVPYPDPTNPNPVPLEFPVTSWSDMVVKTGRPTLAAGVTLMKGTLEMFNKTTGKVVTMPVPIDFTSTTATTIPVVTGLKYDSAMKKLTWNPAVTTNSSMMYAYIVNVDGMVYEVPMGVYDFPVNTLTDGEHKAMVQAKIPNTYPAQVGPLSAPITFTTAGGTASGIPKVVGLTYDSAMKSVRWTPVQTPTPDGFMQFYVYMVEIDGAVIPNTMSMAEYYVMNLTSGAHKIRVQAQLPGSFPPVAGPFSDPFTFTVEGGTGVAIPKVTGITYDSATNKLKWNPVTSTTAAMPFAYNINIDNASFFFGPHPMNEFTLPPSVPAGAHTVMVQAVLNSAPPQMGEWSAPFNFTSTASATGSLQAPVINYDPATKLLSWQPVQSPDAASMVEYKILVNGVEKMMWAQTSINLGNAALGLDFTVNNIITVKAVVYYLNLESAPSNAVNTLGGGTSGAVAAGTYSGRFMGYNGPPVGTLNITVMAGGAFTVSGYNESKQQSFTSSGTVTANNEVIFDVTFLEVLTYKGIANGTVLDGKFYLKNNPAAVIGSWNASMGGGSGALQAPVISYDSATKTLSWPPVQPPTAGAVVEYKIVVNGVEKMMWAQTSINLGQTTIINWSSSQMVTVKAVIYSLNLESAPSNSVTVGGTTPTGSAPSIVTLTYNSTMRKLVWTTDAAAGTTGITYFVSIDNQTPMPQQTMEFYLPATVMDGAHIAMVWTQVMVNGMPVEGAKKSLNFTVGSATGTLGLTFSPMGGTYPNAALSVTITPTPADAKVYYTTNGLAPVPDGTAVAGPKTVSVPAGQQAFVIKAIAHLNGQNSTLYEQSYSTTGGPAIDPATIVYDSVNRKVVWGVPNNLPKPFYVSSCELTNDQGGMTFNGMIPMGSNYMEVPNTGSWLTATSMTVKVKLIVADTQTDLHDPSKTTSGPETVKTLPLSGGTPALPNLTFAPAAVPAGGTSYSGTAPITVTITMPSDIAATSKIKYTMDTAMEPKNGMDYPPNGILLNAAGSYTIKAVAVDMATGTIVKSNPAVMTYVLTGGTTMTPMPPMISPAGGTVTAWPSVTITKNPADMSSASSIYYTTDNSDPVTNGTLYVAPFTLMPMAGATTVTVKAIVGNSDRTVYSAPASQTYTMNSGTAPAAPTFTPDMISSPGSAAVSVSITAPAGAMIKYSMSMTNDGTEPMTPASPYTMPVVVSPVTVSIPNGAKVKIAAVSSANGMDSTIVEKYYNNYQGGAPAAPTMTPVPGTPASSVTLATTTPGATIYYKLVTQMEMPTAMEVYNTGTVYSGPITLTPSGSFVKVAAVTVLNGVTSGVVYGGYTATAPKLGRK